MNLIAVDVGNSAIKIGICGSNDRIERHRFISAARAIREINIPATPCFWSICSVNNKTCNELESWITDNRPDDKICLIQADDIPIRDAVEAREKVGRDRLLAAWAATESEHSNREIVVVDAGTATTIDKIDLSGVFQGGVIFPGARSCLKLLTESTHDLPDYSSTEFATDEILNEIVGKNTESAILRGVFHAHIFAMTRMVESISNDCRVVATGGEIEMIRNFLPKSWRFEPLLVLQGACAIGKLILNGPNDRK